MSEIHTMCMRKAFSSRPLINIHFLNNLDSFILIVAAQQQITTKEPMKEHKEIKRELQMKE